MPDNAVTEVCAPLKILALHGSPHTIQSQTRRLAGFVQEGAAGAGAQTEMIDLADLRITPCTACGGAARSPAPACSTTTWSTSCHG